MPDFVALWQQISFDRSIYGNTVRQWLIALGIVIAAIVILPIINRIVRGRAESLAKFRRARWLAGAAVMLKETRFWFLLSVSIWLGTLALIFPDPEVSTRIQSAVMILLLIQAGNWGSRLIQYLIDRHVQERLIDNPAEVTTMAALGFLGKLVLYAVILLLILDNLGQDPTALVAGLGVGGIAVALAAQNILGDLFSSMSIVLDKPFLLGDTINVGDMTGTVEHIGLKTTRIRSLSGEQLIFTNTDLLQSRIRNYKRMNERRVVFQIGATYETPQDRLEAIPGIIREIIEGCDDTRFDRAHFTSFGDFALIFEVVYYIITPDYVRYMDAQQKINLQINRRFAEAGIEFAYPTQTLFLSHQNALSIANANGEVEDQSRDVAGDR